MDVVSSLLDEVLASSMEVSVMTFRADGTCHRPT